MSELATGDEICAYFTQLLYDTFLPSGRVEYFTKCVWDGHHKFESSVTGQVFEVSATTKIVDATYSRVEVPSLRSPAYLVAEGVMAVSPNGLPWLNRPYANYTVIGAGKTAIDTCLWLLSVGVVPGRITWIMPRDSWFYNRDDYDKALREQTLDIFRAQTRETMAATSLDDLLRRLEGLGILLRLDRKIWPTMFRCATISKAELGAMRRIENVVRLGRVVSIERQRVNLQHGTYVPIADTLFVDCSANGLEKRPPVPVFASSRITLQAVRFCQQVFSAAFIAHVECIFGDEGTKNELCGAIPHPSTPLDLLIAEYLNHKNLLRWSREQKTITWLGKSRLNWSRALAHLEVEDPTERKVAEGRFEVHTSALLEKFKKLIVAASTEEAAKL